MYEFTLIIVINVFFIIKDYYKKMYTKKKYSKLKIILIHIYIKKKDKNSVIYFF